MLRLLPLLLICFSSPIARADILFIDFNMNDKEVATAKASAKTRGEALVVVPDDHDKMAKDYHVRYAAYQKARSAFQAEADKLSIQLSKAKTQQARDALEARIEGVWKELDKLSNERSEYTESLKKINMKEQTEAAIARAAADGRSFSSMVISGHHAGGEYFGRLSGVKSVDLVALLAKFPTATDSIESFYGWGCYTNTREEAKALKSMMPRLKMIAGWDGSAPGQDLSLNHSSMKYLMTKEAEASRLANLQQVKKFFRAIPEVSTGTMAVLVDGCGQAMYASNSVLTTMQDFEKGCTTADIVPIIQNKEMYESFQKASGAGFEEVPANTQSSPLRTFYSNVRKFEHCTVIKELGIDGQKVISLILSREVQKNFSIFYAAEMKRIAELLGEIDPPVPMPVISGKTRRADILQFAEKLYDLLYKNISRKDGKSFESSEIKEIDNFRRKMKHLLVGFSCTPLTWIEPAEGALPESPEDLCVKRY